MSDQKNNSVAFFSTSIFRDRPLQKRFDQWMALSKQTQIRAITLLTGMLYILSTLLDILVAPKAVLPLMIVVHLYILPPLLFLISFLIYRPAYANLGLFLLIIAPFIAAAGNLYIVSHIENPAMRMTELYLILFWTFTVSGLRLWQATISALSTFILVIVVTYFFFGLSTEYFIMHCFWMTSSFSFGFLGAYLLERSDKKLFLHQIELEQQAITDSLTGLYNRTKLETLLQDELYRSQRYNHSFGIVLMDFDFFKKINDTYGHQTGDEALKEIAALITQHLRSTDKAVRWGGEEFMIIYLSTTRDDVLKLAEELRKKVEQHVFKTVGPQTASLGVTVYRDGDTINSIIQRADKALYKAKEHGRNATVFL